MDEETLTDNFHIGHYIDEDDRNYDYGFEFDDDQDDDGFFIGDDE